LQQYRSYSSQDDQLKQIGFEDVCLTKRSFYFSISKTNNRQKQINTRVTADPSSSASNLILIDVREPAELSSTGIIPGAVSVPLASQPDAYFLSPDEFETRFGFPKPGSEQGFSGKKKEIVFYCKAGVRARAAAQLAVQSGYDTASVRVYDGSWLDWMDKGGKVDKWEGDE
jgi:rhodanese-related sulfurtransferase